MLHNSCLVTMRAVQQYVSVSFQHNRSSSSPPHNRTITAPPPSKTRREIQQALDLALTHATRPSALKPSPSSKTINYSSPVTNTPSQGCHCRLALPGGRSSSQQLLKAWSVVPLLFAPAAPDHLPYVHRHLTRIHRLALHACSNGESVFVPS